MNRLTVQQESDVLAACAEEWGPQWVKPNYPVPAIPIECWIDSLNIERGDTTPYVIVRVLSEHTCETVAYLDW